MPKLADQPTLTIRTVAEHAGVAVSTVSRVINGGSVSTKTREKVQSSIALLGFTPTLAAQGLAARRASTVGLVVNSTRGSWFSVLIAGVEEALGTTRRSMLIASLRLTGSYNQGVVVDWIRERRVDGLIFVRCSERERPLFNTASSAGIPIALIAPELGCRAEVTVRCRNDEAGAIAARHLLELGHRRFAFVGGPEGTRDSADRLRGVQEALAEEGVPLPPSAIHHGRSYYSESGADYAKEFVEQDVATRPTAVVLASDNIALGFAKAVLEHGLRIPQDVSIVGFDDSPEAALFWPGLTSVAQPSREMAKAACQALLEHSDAGRSGRTDNFVYDPELVVRESSGPPPRESSAPRRR